MTVEMKTLTIGDTTYEVVDEAAREDIDSINNDANGYLSQAQASATNAAASADNAAAFAMEADVSATKAAGNANAALSNASTASLNAKDAATSATNAANSATAAASSAENAATSADDAGKSANAAANSARNALDSAEAASLSESNAISNAASASTYADNAKSGANTATSKASAAATSATDAANSATDAANSATAAAASATNAANSATAAQEAANSVTGNNVRIPEYWEDHIASKVSAIKALQDEGGKDCFSFIVMTDLHYSSNLGKHSPALARRIMDDCGIRYALVLGDVQNRGSFGTREAVETEWNGIKEMFEPIADSALFQRGNHDGSWGATLNDETYPYNLTPEELYNRVQAKTYRHHDVTTDESGTGYYVDDKPRKVRYIMLNTHCNPYEENSDGSAKYNNMRNFRFTQSQYDMIIEALSTVNEGWAIIVAAHVPIENNYSSAWGGTNTSGDHVIMRNLLKAFRNRTKYNASWVGTAEYDAVSVNADFTGAKGDLVGYFSGHMHADYVYAAADYFGIDIITTRCDGHEENNSTLNAERVVGTTTEQCFDVFTVNKAAGTINATRIGAGSDRIISYVGSVIVTYSVTSNLTGCSISNGATVVESGKAYGATITANEGFELSSVTVTMGGTNITSSAYSNGAISIPSVTGNVVITATATQVAPVTYSVTRNLTACTSSNTATTVTSGNSYTATITANEGYELSSVTVTMGGTNVTNSVYSNGVISIPSVTGNIVITATAVEAGPSYTNLFSTSGEGFNDQGSKFYTNWLPYDQTDNSGTGTCYHFKSFANNAGYTNPYKMQFKTASGSTSAQIYCNTANVKTPTAADYDSSVTLLQHNTNSTDYIYVQFECREVLPSNLIITANQNIVD